MINGEDQNDQEQLNSILQSNDTNFVFQPVFDNKAYVLDINKINTLDDVKVVLEQMQINWYLRTDGSQDEFAEKYLKVEE